MEDGYHPPLEEYLETILGLEEEGTPVIQARIAERLGRSAPAVSEMLGRLEADGFIAREGRAICLTETGGSLATSVVRRHRLAERLLVEVIGLEWHKVHHEAGRWEHVISDDVEEKLVALLGDPGSCPHGNPIPGSANRISIANHRSLDKAPLGEAVTVVRVGEELEHDDDIIMTIARAELIPGSVATVESRDKASLQVLSAQGRLDLPLQIARGLYYEAG